MCQSRRSKLLHAQLTQVVEKHMEARPTDRALMLTLTMRNCEAGELGASISRMTSAFRRLMEFTAVDRAVIGWFRSLEVTISDEESYHPHLHVLLMVPWEYFSKSTDLYLETERWAALWKKALRVDYTPICDVRAIGGGRKKGGSFWEDMKKGLVEVAKYCTKPDSWLTYRPDHPDQWEASIDRLEALHFGLKHKRLIGWGGELKEIFGKLGMADVENPDADLVGKAEGDDEWEVIGFEFYHYRNSLPHVPGAYYLRRKTGPPQEKPPDLHH